MPTYSYIKLTLSVPRWYNMDVTWDTVSNNEFYLCSDNDFYGHVRDMAYCTEDFYAKYPISEVSITHP